MGTVEQWRFGRSSPRTAERTSANDVGRRKFGVGNSAIRLRSPIASNEQRETLVPMKRALDRRFVNIVPLLATFVATLVVAGHASVLGAEPPLTGMVTRNYVDQDRSNWTDTGPRPLQTAIWYPIDEATEREIIFHAPAAEQIFRPVAVAPGAAVSRRSRTYPLIVLSHGTGGSAVMMMWLGTYLASHGYIVAAVNHHGNTAAEKVYLPQGFLLYWERARDLHVVIDRVLRDPLLGARVDRRRIGAAGFSLGGYTVISAVGGRFDPRAFDEFCNSPERDFTCGPQNEFPDAPAKFEALRKTDPVVRQSLRRATASYRDPRIKAAFTISPALGSGFTGRGLRGIRVPVRIVVGDADTVTPPPTNAQRYATLIPGANITVLEGGIGHYTFLHECTERGREVLAICRDESGVDRAAVHETVARMALQFFDSVFASSVR
jgi:predicted dienelactone hydrolase